MVHYVDWKFLKIIYLILVPVACFTISRLFDRVKIKITDSSNNKPTFVELFIDTKSDSYDLKYENYCKLKKTMGSKYDLCFWDSFLISYYNKLEEEKQFEI